MDTLNLQCYELPRCGNMTFRHTFGLSQQLEILYSHTCNTITNEEMLGVYVNSLKFLPLTIEFDICYSQYELDSFSDSEVKSIILDKAKVYLEDISLTSNPFIQKFEINKSTPGPLPNVFSYYLSLANE